MKETVGIVPTTAEKIEELRGGLNKIAAQKTKTAELARQKEEVALRFGAGALDGDEDNGPDPIAVHKFAEIQVQEIIAEQAVKGATRSCNKQAAALRPSVADMDREMRTYAPALLQRAREQEAKKLASRFDPDQIGWVVGRARMVSKAGRLFDSLPPVSLGDARQLDLEDGVTAEQIVRGYDEVVAMMAKLKDLERELNADA